MRGVCHAMDTTAVERRELNVLYIEDNEDDLIMVRDLVHPSRIRLTWAKTIAAARALLGNKIYDLVLLDYSLPDGNGLSFLEEMGWSAPGVPVVVLTGHKDEALAISALQKGAANFVLKDEMSRDLVSAIEEAVERRSEPMLEDGEMAVSDWVQPARSPASPRAPSGPEPAARFRDRAGNFYRTILWSMNEGCLIIDPDGVVTFANPAMERIAGCDRTHLLGINLWDLFEERTAKKLFRIRSRVMRRPAPVSFVFSGQFQRQGNLRSARPIAVTISGRTIYDAGRYKACLLMLALDPDRSTREKLRRETEQMKNDLIASASRDILAHMSESSSVMSLLTGNLSPLEHDRGKYLAEAKQNIQLASKLALDLMTYSMIEPAGIEVRPARLNLRAEIESVCRDLAREAHDHGVSLLLPEAGSADIGIDADPLRMRQALFILIRAAMRMAATKIRVGLSEGPGGVSIAVENDGQDFDTEEIHRLFDKLACGRQALQKLPGPGVGFAVLKEILDAHGGRLSVEPRADGGSRFVMLFPKS